jgi:hypothetical protein
MTDFNFKPRRRLSKAPLYVCGVAVLMTFCMIVWKFNTAELHYSNIDPFSGPLVVDAPGCEMIGPDGKPLAAEFAGKATILIPAGTKFNGDCFPVAKAAIKTEGQSR